MPNVSAPNTSVEYTATASGLQASRRGLYAVDYVASVYGTASIDFLIGGTYYAALEMTAQTSTTLTIPPSTTYRVTVDGTDAVVRLTELDYHTA